ncbi:hypothetical protein HOP50_05g35520 [Chloropicon primus]|uniref:Adhesin domain-containing protein n=1 Tax=Chloropicon primus TaxID=1764295 RepID=A0A5B8MKP2_9CHLO|nr:hypothetical protein A3770_05p35450 [Chloropicon primus]UPR00238.1 hypothetical protein HOP50_05g35520 [Chloropicon primus]|eukprot:QDZ21027.1 hypothetical protein A3770_05p35450 [Chloropicon primus]
MHMVTKRREGGRPPSRLAKLQGTHLGSHDKDKDLLPLTIHHLDSNKNKNTTRDKQKRARNNRKGKARELMLKHKEKFHKIIRSTALGISVCMLGLILASIILIVQVEYCRYPRHSKEEEFRYEISFEATNLTKIARDGKIKKVIGPKIDELRIEQNFGTVKFVENSDLTANEVVFRVKNRAADKYFLSRISRLHVDIGQKVLLVGNKPSELRANVTLEARTSNSLSGAFKCRRADVEVEVPTACLLDETKLITNVTKGHITSRSLSAANFETVSIVNEVGDIQANDLHAFKIELNTSTGTISTNNTACHTMRVNTDEDRDGAILNIHNVTLFEGDNKNACVEATEYAPGFPQTKEYEVRTLHCETEPGVLVIDSKGAENGGKPAVYLGRIKGGNVKQKIKVGHTRLQVMGCLDFIGQYVLRTAAGSIKINEKTDHFRDTGFFQVALSNEAGSLVVLNTRTSTTGTKYGTICQNQTFAQVGDRDGTNLTNQTLEIEAEVTGDIYLDVYPPYIT